MEDSPKKISYWKLAPSWMAIVIDSMGFGLVYPLMAALFAGEKGFHLAKGLSLTLRHFYLGLSFLLYPLFMFFGASFLGDLSDIWGRKKVLVICMAGITISFFLMGFGVTFASILTLMIGRALSGLMAGSQPIAQAAISDLSTPETKARNLSYTAFVISIGIVIGPFIGGFFSDQKISSFFTLATPFYFAAILSLITTLWLLFGFKETFLKLATHKKIHWLRPFQIFKEGFYHPSVRFLAIAFFFMQAGIALFFQLLQVLMVTFFGYESWLLGLFNAYLGVGFVVFTLFGMRIFLKVWKVSFIAVIALLLTGIGIILAMIFPNESLIWILAFFVAGFDMVAYAAIMTLFSNSVDEKSQGWVMGIFYSTMSIAWALTGFSTNLIQFLGLRWLIVIGGILMLLSSFLVFVYRKAFPLGDYD